MIEIPTYGQGKRPTPENDAAYESKLEAWAHLLRNHDNTPTIQASARGHAYALEQSGLITKADFDRAENATNECRKRGILPFDFCSGDESRMSEGAAPLWGDLESVEEYAGILINSATAILSEPYAPVAAWEGQTNYIEVVVEKGDLVKLFAPVCREFGIAITNFKGWSDLNSRNDIAQRFKAHEQQGRRPILLAFNDHDPGGFQISDYMHSNFEDIRRGSGWEPLGLRVIRVGINMDFIRRHRIPAIDNLISGAGRDLSKPHNGKPPPQFILDYIAKYGVRKWEANALVSRSRTEPARALLRREILKHFDIASAKLRDEQNEAENAKVQALVAPAMAALAEVQP